MENKKERILLTETFVFDYSQIITEGIENNHGRVILRGVIQAANRINGNGRIYPRPVLEEAVNRYNQLIQKGGGYSELDHADKNVIEWMRTSHRMTKIWWEGDEVMGELILFNTPYTEVIKEAIATGGKIGISSRAEGSITQKNGQTFVDMGLDLISFDLVTNPSTFGAYMEVQAEKSIYESMGKKTVTEGKFTKVENILSELLKKVQ